MTAISRKPVEINSSNFPKNVYILQFHDSIVIVTCPYTYMKCN